MYRRMRYLRRLPERAVVKPNPIEAPISTLLAKNRYYKGFNSFLLYFENRISNVTAFLPSFKVGMKHHSFFFNT